MIENNPHGYGQAALTEMVAMLLFNKISPTAWTQITAEQRNGTRRHANLLINEALEFWDRENSKGTDA